MTFINRFFASNKKKITQSAVPQLEYEPTTCQFPFSEYEHVRVIFFRETETAGKKLLFDSSAVKREFKPPYSQNNAKERVEYSEGTMNYKYDNPDEDSDNIGELIFGTTSMSYKGAALKVHWLQEPQRILCSQVFQSPTCVNSYANYSSEAFQQHSNNETNTALDNISLNSFSIYGSDNSNETTQTIPLDVPPPWANGASSIGSRGFAYSAGDSGYSGTDGWNISTSSGCRYSSTRSSLGSVYSDQASSRKLSLDSNCAGDPGCMIGAKTSSESSLHRRIMRNISTSFENKSSISDLIGYIGDNQPPGTPAIQGGSDSSLARIRRNSENAESRSNPEMTRKRTDGALSIPQQGHVNRGKRTRLGLAVCITLSEPMEDEMEQFCSEHIGLLESMLCRLRANTEKAYMDTKHLRANMIQAWLSTTRWLRDLFIAPRIACPIWLALSSSNDRHSKAVADNFMNDMDWLLSNADTKDTNFFLSKLLTAILTHHLGWVATVAPMNLFVGECFGDHENEICCNDKISEISKKYPYNALWAQLSDLYGAVGNPGRIAKSIICGVDKNANIIRRVLNILTYFIRCCEVKRDIKNELFRKEAIDEILVIPIEENPNVIKMPKIDDELNNIIKHNDFQAFDPLNKNLSMSECDCSKDRSLEPRKLGMTRNSSWMKNLSEITHSTSAEALNNEKLRHFELANKRNDIPNVLMYNDSRFVKQELRIGNFQMDTGLKMNSKSLGNVHEMSNSKPITFTVTSPDNVEIPLSNTDDQNATVEGAEEALELVKDNLHDPISSHVNPTRHVKFAKPETIPRKSPSLSEIITANSVGGHKGSRYQLLWREPIEEGTPIDHRNNIEEINYANSLQAYNTSLLSIGHDMDNGLLKRSQSLNSKSTNPKNGKHRKPICSKKSSNTQQEFYNSDNFESDSNLKASRSLGDLITADSVGQSVSFHWGIEPEKENVCLEEVQHFEKNLSRRTPEGNVEFVLGENEALVGLKAKDLKNYGPNSFLNLNLLKKENKKHSALIDAHTKNERSEKLISINNEYDRKMSENMSSKRRSSSSKRSVGEGSSSSCSKHIEPTEPKIIKPFNVMQLPLSSCETSDNSTMKKLKPGFVPSLFTQISDHYIADMVLQGTTAPQNNWENALKQDLALAAHCATIEQCPTENIAIVADIERWDVKIYSSQSSGLGNRGTTGTVGMSHLVSNMLETTHAMYSAGISSLECMAFIESKLHEIFLYSETLAEVLLRTDFCSVHGMTNALNLTEEDVPLLLSVASINYPMVMKRYSLGPKTATT